MKQYLDICRRIVDEGVWVENERTGKRCLTVIDASMEYDVGRNEFPLVTTRKAYWKSAIAELLGYLRGYDSAAQFRAIGCNTWNANANETPAWLDNPARKGADDLGRIYGVQLRSWQCPDGSILDQLKKVVDNLSRGVDDRREVITYYNPGELHLGCLRPCIHTHTFSLLGGTLNMTSYQASADFPLGIVANAPQTFVMLALMARITGNRPGRVFHKIVNCHIYEDQLPAIRDIQLKRDPYPLPQLFMNESIKSLEDIDTWVSTDDFELVGYRHHDPIAYPFSV